MIKNAEFTSVWDDSIVLQSRCNVNTKTRQITKIEMTISIPDTLESG